jgi:hypothetical protein
MKVLPLSIALLLAYSCSQSNDFYQKASEPTPIAHPEALKKKGLLTDEGQTFKTDAENSTIVIDVKNLDPETRYEYDVKLEKDEEFKIGKERGGKIPPGGKIEIPVDFKPSRPGHHADNVIITYFDPENPDDKKVIIYPIRGEKSDRPKESVKVIITDFGKTVIKQPIEDIIVISNPDNREVNLDITPPKDGSFTISPESDCGTTLGPKEECTIRVVFDNDKPGIKQDELIIRKTTPEGKTTDIKVTIIGEKIEDLTKCDGKPCDRPYKEGQLISSEVFSDNVDFGRVSVGLKAEKQVEIQNLGDTALALKRAAILDQSVFSFSGGKYPGLKGTCGNLVLPGSCVLEFAYGPRAVQNDSTAFEIETVEGPKLKLTLSGQGVNDKCEDSKNYLIIPEKSYPAAQVTFPYLLSHPGTPAILSVLYGTEVNSFVPQINDYTVKDGQVYITFKMPEMEGEITSMDFGVNVFKAIRDNFKDTESLCISSASVRKCSGQQFSLASWQRLMNPKFWDIYRTPINERYIEQLVFNEEKCGNLSCLSLKTRYELRDIFELSKTEFEAIRKDKVFSLIFSDDTRMLSMPRISVKTKVMDECK